jgi:hypothetical protein
MPRPQRHLIDRAASSADKGGGGPAAELFGVRTHRRDELAVERPQRTGDAVEHIALESPQRHCRDIGGFGVDDELTKFVHLASSHLKSLIIDRSDLSRKPA